MRPAKHLVGMAVRRQRSRPAPGLGAVALVRVVREAELAAGPSHPAMFAAVMRKVGVPKQVECHGFVCDSPEESILVAANLYQALLETMKRNKRTKTSSQVSLIIYLSIQNLV